MTFDQLIEQTGRDEVNLALLLLVIAGAAMAGDKDGSIEAMVQSLFCPAEEL